MPLHLLTSRSREQNDGAHAHYQQKGPAVEIESETAAINRAGESGCGRDSWLQRRVRRVSVPSVR